MNIFHRTFATGEVSEATGASNDAIQNWIKRDLLVGQGNIQGGGGKGRHRQFSFHNVMEIAIAQAILNAGGLADLNDVFRAANHFAHSADVSLPEKPTRLPGMPFNVAASKTFLLVGRGWSDEIVFTGKDSIFHLAAPLLERGGCMVIDASAVFDATMQRLGLDPVQVKLEAYGE